MALRRPGKGPGCSSRPISTMRAGHSRARAFRIDRLQAAILVCQGGGTVEAGRSAGPAPLVSLHPGGRPAIR